MAPRSRERAKTHRIRGLLDATLQCCEHCRLGVRPQLKDHLLGSHRAAAYGEVLKSAGFHLLGVVKIAPVENDRGHKSTLYFFKVGMPKRVPFRVDRQRVGAVKRIQRIVFVSDFVTVFFADVFHRNGVVDADFRS